MQFTKMSAFACVCISIFLITPSFGGMAAEEVFRRYTVDIVNGFEHSCALSNDRKVKCWGSNNYAQLGVPNISRAGNEAETMGSNLVFTDLGKNFEVGEICSGGYHSCALSVDHKVKCWGYNALGQLGQGRNDFSVGNASGQMGEGLPFTDLGSDFKPEHISCGYQYSCAVSIDGRAKCWGTNSRGALGLDPKAVTAIGRLPADMGDNLKPLVLKSKVKKIVAGHNETCAGFVDRVACWGGNTHGETGIESNLQSVPLLADSEPVAVKLEAPGVLTEILDLYGGVFVFCAKYLVRSSGSFENDSTPKLKCWGDNRSGQLGIGEPAVSVGRDAGTLGSKLPEVQLGWENWDEVYPHGDFTCALYRAAAKCWGRNDQGTLGLGDIRSRGKSPNDLGKNLSELNLNLPVLKLARGPLSAHSCALLVNHEVKCWGRGLNGVLGYENEKTVGVLPDDMGSNLQFVKIW